MDETDAILDEIISGQPLHDQMVHDELRKLRARADARRIFDSELRGPLPPFDAGTLAEVLARPAEPRSRVDQLIPWKASTLLTAQRKTGKTTTVLNLARSVLTGEDFLGRFGVRRVDGSVALLNFEVSAAQLGHWAADVGVPRDRMFLVNLRGRRNPLGSDDDRQALGALLRSRGVETIICDPFGRAYTGTSQNDAGEVGTFLSALDQFARAEVGALDLVLTAHAGWNGERTRGSTALEDWADSIITLTRDDTDEGKGERYLRAIGRDVDLEEDQMLYDPETRLLTLAGAGSRRAAGASRRADELQQAVAAIVIQQPGVNGAQVEHQLREAGRAFQKGQERKALTTLCELGLILREKGPKNSNLYRPNPQSPQPPQPPQRGAEGASPPPYIRGRHTGDTEHSPVSPTICAACELPMTVVEPGQTTHPGCITFDWHQRVAGARR